VTAGLVWLRSKAELHPDELRSESPACEQLKKFSAFLWRNLCQRGSLSVVVAFLDLTVCMFRKENDYVLV
jgi:hypothetical protein